MDEDRGTYSPPTEDNLSYQTRRAPGRDQAPLTLIISGIFLVLLLVFVVVFYNSGLNNHGRTPPDVGNPVGEFKDAQIQDAKPLSGDEGADTGQAKFAPSAEAPALRDAASGAVDEAPPPVAPINGPLPSQANNPAVNGNSDSGDTTPVPGAPQTSPQASADAAGKLAIDKALTPAPATKPSKLADATPAKPAAAKPAAPKTADNAATPAAATASAGGAVQIGAFTSMDIANKEYASVASSYGLFLGGTSKHIEKVDKNGATFYRTSFAGFASKDKARSFCSALKAAGHDCLVK